MLSLFSFDTIIQFSSDTIVVVSIRSLSVCVGGGGGGGQCVGISCSFLVLMLLCSSSPNAKLSNLATNSPKR